MKVVIAKKVLEANEKIADANRRLFRDKGLAVVNLIGSPGAGKTSLLERTIDVLGGDLRMCVVEGDMFTSRDAERIGARGVEAVQLNTRGACHLDAGMLSQALAEMDLERFDLLFVENVGNLVCPAEYDLGEDATVTVLSVPEGSDKPEKYPLAFRRARAVVVTKADLVGHTEFDLDQFQREVARLNEEAAVLITSAKTGEGMDKWCRWLENLVKEKKSRITA